jgi:hypothetical protein
VPLNKGLARGGKNADEAVCAAVGRIWGLPTWWLVAPWADIGLVWLVRVQATVLGGRCGRSGQGPGAVLVGEAVVDEGAQVDCGASGA